MLSRLGNGIGGQIWNSPISLFRWEIKIVWVKWFRCWETWFFDGKYKSWLNDATDNNSVILWLHYYYYHSYYYHICAKLTEPSQPNQVNRTNRGEAAARGVPPTAARCRAPARRPLIRSAPCRDPSRQGTRRSCKRERGGDKDKWQSRTTGKRRATHRLKSIAAFWNILLTY